jgi:thiamine kinase-like enzyme
MDLHLRNFLVDVEGRIWIIDWANAGAFPPWLEYAHTATWANAARKEFRPPKIWTFFLRFIVGDYRRYMTDYLDNLGWAWDRHADDFFPLDYFSNLGLTVD